MSEILAGVVTYLISNYGSLVNSKLCVKMPLSLSMRTINLSAFSGY